MTPHNSEREKDFLAALTLLYIYKSFRELIVCEILSVIY